MVSAHRVRKEKDVDSNWMLSGNLRDLPFPSLLRALVGKTGVLELWSLENGARYTLYLKRGEIRCLEGEQGFLDQDQAKRVLKALFTAQTGAFEFVAKEDFPTPCRPAFRWPVERVVRSLNLRLTREKLRETLESLF